MVLNTDSAVSTGKAVFRRVVVYFSEWDRAELGWVGVSLDACAGPQQENTPAGMYVGPGQVGGGSAVSVVSPLGATRGSRSRWGRTGRSQVPENGQFA